MLQNAGLGDGGIDNVKTFMDQTQGTSGTGLIDIAAGQIFGVFALILTSVGMPMFLAGEEFGDVHDLDFNATNPKQQYPVQWYRATLPSNAAFQTRVGELIALHSFLNLTLVHPNQLLSSCRLRGLLQVPALNFSRVKV